jgi:hypothetical protein
MKIYGFKDVSGVLDVPASLPSDDELPPLRGREICEVIESAQILYCGDRPATAKEIWEYSPSGELYMLPEWYGLAVIKIGIENDDIILDIRVALSRVIGERFQDLGAYIHEMI